MTDNLPDVISGEVLPAQADAAHAMQSRIQESIRLIRRAWVLLAEDLYRFQELQMWRHLGYTSFEQWLAGPDIDLERRWVYDLVAIWRELAIVRGVDPESFEGLHVSKVREVLPAIRRGHVSVAEAFADCRALPRRDLEVRYRGLVKPVAGERFEATDEPEWAICHACGSRYSVGRAA